MTALLIIIGFVIVGLIYIIKKASEDSRNTADSSSYDEQMHNSKRKTYKPLVKVTLPDITNPSISYSIKGINFRNLGLEDLGPFTGYAEAELHNEYDEYAIGIYKDDGLMLGYLPSGNKDQYEYMVSVGRYLKVRGNVKIGDDGDHFYGYVYVPYDPKDSEPSK